MKHLSGWDYSRELNDLKRRRDEFVTGVCRDVARRQDEERKSLRDRFRHTPSAFTYDFTNVRLAVSGRA